MQNLTVRLEMVFDQVKKAAGDNAGLRIIDVGSDHGYLAVRCLDDGIAGSVICTEIHEAPAKRSSLALNEAGYTEISEVFVTDGLKGVPLKYGDIVVIAGMGGLNIIDILTRALKDNGSSVFEKVTFVLQPQKSVELVRQYLSGSGFYFADETVCCDRDIFYNCMRIGFNGMRSQLTNEEACYGPVLLKKRPQAFLNLLNYRIQREEEILESIRHSEKREHSAAAVLHEKERLRLTRILKEVAGEPGTDVYGAEPK